VDEGSSEEDFESDLEKVPPQTEDEEMSERGRSGEEEQEELGRGARGRANVRVFDQEANGLSDTDTGTDVTGAQKSEKR
jgi:hypothetical protein